MISCIYVYIKFLELDIKVSFILCKYRFCFLITIVCFEGVAVFDRGGGGCLEVVY